jgi:Short C-terminal domain
MGLLSSGSAGHLRFKDAEAHLQGTVSWIAQRNLDLPAPPGDVSRVTTQTLLKILSASLLGVALAGRASAHDEVGYPVSMGRDTYSITATAGSAFMTDTDKLKDEANAAAVKYCEDHGKVLKVVSITSKSPHFSLGYCSGKVVFMALAPGDPALLPPAPATAPGYAAEPAAVAAPRSLTTDELVAELTKLDDLRKKGILSDDEFQAEKKKVLSHTN